jgi:osmotically-inducible protein OsmY
VWFHGRVLFEAEEITAWRRLAAADRWVKVARMMVDQILRSLQKNVARRLWLVLGIGILAGCAGYDRDEGGRTTGEVTDDTAIQAVLKSHLVDDQLIRGWRIDTEVYKGVITLRGSVRSEEERRRALEIARGINGVRDVKDELVIENP